MSTIFPETNPETVPQAPHRLERRKRRRSWMATALVVTITVVGAFGIWWWVAVGLKSYALTKCGDPKSPLAELSCNGLLAVATLDAGQEAAIQYNLGRRAFEKRKYKTALSKFRRALKMEHDAKTTQYWMGRSLARLDQDAQAVEAHDRAYKLGYGDIAKARRGEALLWSGNPAAALKDFQDLAAKHEVGEPVNWVHYGEGVALHKLGRHEEAVAALDLHITQRADDADALAYRAEAFYVLGRYTEALAAANDALIENRRSRRGRSIKARSLDALGRYDEALTAYDWLIENRRHRFAHQIHKGRMQGNAGDFDSAREILETATDGAIMPLTPEMALLKVLCAQNDPVAADALLAKIMKRNPDMQWLISQLDPNDARQLCGVARPVAVEASKPAPVEAD